jgi:hypothetical protein
MRRPHCCPICNDFSINVTLQDYQVIAKVKGENRDVNALAAFACEQGHIFFLRTSDLVVEDQRPRGAAGA